MKKKTSVFISGGGIGGLTIGLKLAKCGVDVTVVEKLPGPTPVYKGELLQPKSLDILDKLNLLNPTLENGHTIKELDLVEMTSRLKEIDTSVMKYDVIPSDYAYSLMIHHEKIKEIVRDEALKYPHFHYIPNSICKGFRENYAIVKKDKKEEIHVEADFFIGAEGRTSATRNEMGINVKESIYNHHFLTVTFPRPKDFTRGKIISTHDRFLGLFPLPNNEVRSVYLIPAGKYKELRKQSLDYVYKLYTDLVPELEGYVNKIDSWKKFS
ncbi:FAD-dependent monooxygenase [Bacillus coahuilensis]|uniref:FAD-dependent monooxygenase n=1 Tax=Bacillus coahuilensis TaxID=408580 RepID=UPI000ADA785A